MKFTLGYHEDLNKELDALQRVYEALGVEVLRLQSLTHDAVFHRDVAAWTPMGIIKANMGKKSRRWEPNEYFKQVGLRADGPERVHALRLKGHERFEGADLLWTSPRDVIVAWGSRTTGTAASRITVWLREHGYNPTMVAIPTWHDQHLLGVANCISPLVFSYDEVDLCGAKLPGGEYHLKGSNWVQVGEHVVINEDCKETIKMIEPYCSVMPVNIKGLLYHGGGVACATGVLEYVLQSEGSKRVGEVSRGARDPGCARECPHVYPGPH